MDRLAFFRRRGPSGETAAEGSSSSPPKKSSKDESSKKHRSKDKESEAICIPEREDFPADGFKRVEWHYCLLHCRSVPLDHLHFKRSSSLCFALSTPDSEDTSSSISDTPLRHERDGIDFVDDHKDDDLLQPTLSDSFAMGRLTPAMSTAFYEEIDADGDSLMAPLPTPAIRSRSLPVDSLKQHSAATDQSASSTLPMPIGFVLDDGGSHKPAIARVRSSHDYFETDFCTLKCGKRDSVSATMSMSLSKSKSLSSASGSGVRPVMDSSSVGESGVVVAIDSEGNMTYALPRVVSSGGGTAEMDYEAKKSASAPVSSATSSGRTARAKSRALSFLSRFSLTKPSRSPSPSRSSAAAATSCKFVGGVAVMHSATDAPRPLGPSGIDYNKQLSYLTDVLASHVLQYILEFLKPYDLCKSITLVSVQMHAASEKVWRRKARMKISPKDFRCLQKDFRVWYHHKKLRSRATATEVPIDEPRLNQVLHHILAKVGACRSLRRLEIYRTMITGPLLQQLCLELPKLKELGLLENPLSLSGANLELPQMDPTLFRFEGKPCFELESFYIRDMYPEVRQQSLQSLLETSQQSLKSLVIYRKSPFECSFCRKMSLCKFHKCEVCEIRSYCSADCQRDDWQYHQLVCHSHDPLKTLRRASQTKTLDQMATIISLCSSLVSLDLSYTFVAADFDSIALIANGCKQLTDVRLNGCDLTSAALDVLATKLKLRLFHCRMARSLTDDGVYSLIDHCADTLEDIDLSRCICIHSLAILELLQRCHELTSANIACGMKRGAWIWGVDDKLADAILALPKLTYLGFIDSDEMSDEKRDKVFGAKSDREFKIDCLRSSVKFEQHFQPREDLKPVTSLRVVNGTVENKTFFRR